MTSHHTGNSRIPFQCHIRSVVVKSRKVSQARDRLIRFSNRSAIWQWSPQYGTEPHARFIKHANTRISCPTPRRSCNAKWRSVPLAIPAWCAFIFFSWPLPSQYKDAFFYQYRDFHNTMDIPIPGKTVFILRRGPFMMVTESVVADHFVENHT